MAWNYRELVVWEKSLDVAEMVYKVVKMFPKEEKHGLVAQLRRCIISISSNIAEGAGRKSYADFCRFLDIAKGSANESYTQLVLAHRMGYIDGSTLQHFDQKITEICKMISGLKRSLKK